MNRERIEEIIKGLPLGVKLAGKFKDARCGLISEQARSMQKDDFKENEKSAEVWKVFDSIKDRDPVSLLAEEIEDCINRGQYRNEDIEDSANSIILIMIAKEIYYLNRLSRELALRSVKGAFSAKNIGKDRHREATEEIEQVLSCHDSIIVRRAIDNLLRNADSGLAQLNALSKEKMQTYFNKDNIVLPQALAAVFFMMSLPTLVLGDTLLSRESAFGLLGLAGIAELIAIIFTVAQGVIPTININKERKAERRGEIESAYAHCFDEIIAEISRLEVEEESERE